MEWEWNKKKISLNGASAAQPTTFNQQLHSHFVGGLN